jgi:hypothetical protein
MYSSSGVQAMAISRGGKQRSNALRRRSDFESSIMVLVLTLRDTCLGLCTNHLYL